MPSEITKHMIIEKTQLYLDQILIAVCACCVATAIFLIYYIRRRRIRNIQSKGLCWMAQDKYWEISSYALVSLLAVNDATFCGNYLPAIRRQLPSEDRDKFSLLFNFLGSQVLSLEGDSQRKVHKILAKQFSFRDVQEYRDGIHQIVDELLDGAQKQQNMTGSWDVVKDFASQLPLKAIVHVLGLPDEDCAKLKQWVL